MRPGDIVSAFIRFPERAENGMAAIISLKDSARRKPAETRPPLSESATILLFTGVRHEAGKATGARKTDT